MNRFRAGWGLTKKSWQLLRENGSLLRFPILGALAALVVMGVVVVPGLYLIDSNASAIGGAVLTAIGFYLAIFIGYFFSVGLAATADRVFRGERASFADGLGVARSRAGAIAGWALLSLIVGAFFAAVEQIRGFGPIISSLMNAAWSLITFIAVPVIAIEGTGPIETTKRSAALFRERWAGQITGNALIGGIVFLVGVLPAFALVAVGIYLWGSNANGDEIAAGAALVALGAILLVFSLLVMRALSGVFGVALYRYAVEGQATGGFTSAELESAVKPR